MSYLALKHMHLTAVAISLCFFFLRGIWMFIGSEQLKKKWVRILPHVVDTLLLASALGLAWTIQQYPFVDAWLTAKVLALLGYIFLGSIAIRYGKTRKVRTLAFIGALCCVAYILRVAITHQAWPF